jgi:hypothetical protein
MLKEHNEWGDLAMTNQLKRLTEEELMDAYDRLASKWAQKMEARQRDKQRSFVRKLKGA